MIESDIIMVNDPHSPRGLFDCRALYGKPNRPFHYLLLNHGHISPHVGDLLVGYLFLREDIESGSSCSQNSCRCIGRTHNKPFYYLSLAWYEFIDQGQTYCSSL